VTDTPSQLPARPSLEQLHKQARELLERYKAGEADALERFRASGSRAAGQTSVRPVSLADAHLVLAREHGFESWAKLKRHIESLPDPRLQPYEKLAEDIVTVCHSQDEAALQRITELYGRTYPYPDRRSQLQQRLAVVRGPDRVIEDITLEDARLLVARRFGFENWAELIASVDVSQTAPPSSRHAKKKTPRQLDKLGMSTRPPFYKIDWKDNTIELRPPPLSKNDWNVVFDVMKEHRLTKLNAGGMMTDIAMGQLARLDHVTDLLLEGSKMLTDEGLRHLAGMPQLRSLDISGWDSQITDRGLEVLGHLHNLREFQSCWNRGISDSGIAHLAGCDQLESVNLLGSPTGDAAIKASMGKTKLRHLKTGKQVSDSGLAMLHNVPAFKTWHGGEIEYSLMSPNAGPNHLLLDGPFSNKGFESIVGLDGLFGLTFFWHTSGLSSAGLKVLAELPRLGFLGCQDQLCDDQAMRYIGSLHGLRMLMGQGAVAGDEGFKALSRSRTIEYIWGRDCPNLNAGGFAAMAAMPALRGLAVSCENVDDGALSTLPRFPSLTKLAPMGFNDDGFRHIGLCEKIEELWCMYCRRTGDVASRHLAGLHGLKTYYAGATQITDESLRVLAGLRSLEVMEFYECARITNAGVAVLAGLPRLREVTIGGSANVTREGMTVFPPTVRVHYW